MWISIPENIKMFDSQNVLKQRLRNNLSDRNNVH